MYIRVFIAVSPVVTAPLVAVSPVLMAPLVENSPVVVLRHGSLDLRVMV